MPVVINPASEIGKELRKWEQHHTAHSIDENYESRPGNPYVFREYPKMLYKAMKRSSGQVACQLPPPPLHLFSGPNATDEWQREMVAVETFNNACRKVVQDEAQERLASGQGWSTSQQGAIDRFEQDERAIGNAAAEAAHAVRRMSASAQAEYADAERQTIEHVTDVKPAKRRGHKRRGRPRKAVIAVSGDREHDEEGSMD